MLHPLRSGLTLLFLSFLCTCGRAQETAPEVPTFQMMVDSFGRYVAALPNDEARMNAYARMITWKVKEDSAFTFVVLDKMKTLTTEQTTPRYNLFFASHQALVASQYESPRAATDLLTSALARAAPGTSPEYLALAERTLGDLYKQMADYREALHHLQLALSHYREIDFAEKEALLLNSIGGVHSKLKNYSLAIENYEQALIVYEKTGEVPLKGTIKNNLAGVYNKQEKYDKALALYDEAIAISRTYKYPLWGIEVSARVNKATVFRKQKKFAAALAVYQEAYPLIKKYAGRSARSATLLGTAQSLQGLKRYREAVATCREAFAEGGHDYPQTETYIYRTLSKAYLGLGQVDSSSHYLTTYVDAQKTLDENTNAAAIAELETRYETARKEQKIERLAAADARSREEISRLWWYLGLGTIALFLIGRLAYRTYRQRQRIQQQNRIITKAMGEKEVLMKEIHHRVKNNLQMVSSLLTLQSDYVEDNAALDALNSGKSRVRSMALIHQNLYLDDQVTTTVNAKNYLEKLVGEVTESLRAPGQVIKRITDIVDAEMDIDLMIPLGLLTNELITNAMKYAFNNKDTGVLRVSLLPEGSGCRLAVSDNGGGFQEGDNGGTSFGSLLVETLADQLEAVTNVQSDENGTIYTFDFDPNNT